MRRLRLLFAVVFTIAAGCSFPEVSYETADSGNSESSSGSTSSSGSGSGGGASSSSGSGGDGAVSSDAPADRTMSMDAPGDVGIHDTSSSSSGGDGSVNCDQDNDTFKGPQCGGTDCCDTDPNAHPNQMMFFTMAPDNCMSWDYNCDGTIEYEFPQNIPCTGTPTLGCSGGPGFLGTEACGQTGPYGSCQPNGAVLCSLKQTGSDIQGCQ